MGEQALGALAVDLAAEDAAAIGAADGDGRVELSGRAIAQSRCFGHDLIEGGVDVVGKLNFDHRAQAVCAHPDRRCDNTSFGDGGIEATLPTVAGLQTFGHAKHAAEIADILAKCQDVRVARHHHVERGIQSLHHIHRRHGYIPSSWRCLRRCQGISA